MQRKTSIEARKVRKISKETERYNVWEESLMQNIIGDRLYEC